MPSSTASVLLPWATTISRKQLGHPVKDTHGMPASQAALGWVATCTWSCQHTLQAAQPGLHSYRHLVSHHTVRSQGQRRSSSYPWLAIVPSVCPECWYRPKSPDHRFCSVACARSAARLAPGIKYLPPNHELSVKVATQFIRCWPISIRRPKVLAVFMITWTESYHKRFEQYRDTVEARGQFKLMGCSSGNEQKRFRGANRACNLGERGNLFPCHDEACLICETIRYGFEPHLLRKRDIPCNGAGIRLGPGIYTSHSSSKADQYAKNLHDPSSSIRAMLVCRVVIGKPYLMFQEDPTIRTPPLGYDCVSGQPGWQSVFTEDEYVVYDADAIRAAYLVLYDKAPSA